MTTRARPKTVTKLTADRFRKRMRCVGDLLRDGLGLGGELDAAAMTRDAYRIVVAKIIEILVTGTEELTTSELATLSKVLAEQRRLDLAQTELDRKLPAPSTDDESSGPRTLSDSFGHIVKRIYGTNLSADCDARSDS
jgi:uncharacterized membrane protein